MDITKCSGKDCNLKDTCYRYTAKSDSERQSFFVEPPIKDGKCDMYWGNESTRILKNIKDILNGKL